MIFAGNANKELAEKVVSHLNMKLGKATVGCFSDGETMVELLENVRGKDVFILQSTSFPTNDNLMEILVTVDALRRSSAARITAAIPYLGYSRQDRRPRSARVAITAKVVANMLTTVGVNRLLTMDLHSDQIQGFFDIPVDHLYSSSVFIPYIQSLNLPNLTIASPDMGGSNRANTYAKFLNSEIVVCYKHREKANEVGKMLLIGDVKGKDVVLVDDMVDTAGTLTKAAEVMIESGANSVRAICTHGVFSGPAYERIDKSPLIEIAVTDTILKDHQSDKVNIISIADLFASSIEAVLKNESISKHYLR